MRVAFPEVELDVGLIKFGKRESEFASYGDQVRVAWDVDVLVGFSGAGWLNQMWMPRTGVGIEFIGRPGMWGGGEEEGGRIGYPTMWHSGLAVWLGRAHRLVYVDGVGREGMIEHVLAHCMESGVLGGGGGRGGDGEGWADVWFGGGRVWRV